MSAIAGILNFNKNPLIPQDTTNLMKAFQRYPADHIDTWKNNQVFLGCHAQWITPESIGEPLPYYDYEKRVAITADAIIDNREELFDKLHIGHANRKVIPDSQLILLAYHKWGEEVPKHLIGDFAFMIWDEKNGHLFGARDFSGARTLYFYYDSNRFAFSTTVAPLFQLPYIKKKINEEWLAEFLAIPGMVESVDSKSTVYKAIYQIPPFHSITVKDGRVTFSRYGRIEAKKQLKLKSEKEYDEAFNEVFQEAITSRVRTHGKVGSHLSGGLDSGTVVSFAAKALKKENKRLYTFSSVPEKSFVDWTPDYYLPNETSFIKETVNYVGNIEDQYLDFSGKSPLTELDDFLELMEMPYKFFENMFWLKGINQVAHQKGIKILLNGARGNHSISWGSWQLTMDYYASLLKRLKWLTLNRELSNYCQNFNTDKFGMLPNLAKQAFPLLANMVTKTVKLDPGFPVYINTDLAKRTNIFTKLEESGVNPTGNIAKDLNEHRINHYNQPYAWNKSGTATTKLSLRYGLWDRDPTNDIRVIRFCLSLPAEQYVQGGMERSFIRRVTKGVLPDKVRLNHQVRGIQGADTIHRMTPIWNVFLHELKQLSTDPLVYDFINLESIRTILAHYGEEIPHPGFVHNEDFKILTRSLIVYRFIKNFHRKEVTT
ncbi:asparagine synthase-related protein [Neobacillus vireti]|uniref:asparagine synthase-related protein n=1 Tax=Neobacillus vireti TaxID=220686 RepID=UPI002FFDD8E3